MEMQDFFYAIEIACEKKIIINEEHEQYLWENIQGFRKKYTWKYGLIALEKLLSVLKTSEII